MLMSNVEPFTDEQLQSLFDKDILISDYIEAYHKALATCKRLMKERDDCDEERQHDLWEREEWDGVDTD